VQLATFQEACRWRALLTLFFAICQRLHFCHHFSCRPPNGPIVAGIGRVDARQFMSPSARLGLLAQSARIGIASIRIGPARRKRADP
jgi:hypothetical protein